jgi:hypothetical protein
MYIFIIFIINCSRFSYYNDNYCFPIPYFFSRSTVRLLIGFFCLLFVLLNINVATATQAVLVRDQKAMMPVIVAQDATARIRQAAKNLANYLGKISDTTVEITTGDGTQGIVVGVFSDFPNLTVGKDLQPTTIAQRERYRLQSHAEGLYVMGATETAVEDAVWDLLYRLGYRQFFPGPTWEVIPKMQTVVIDISSEEQPDYWSRRIWYNWGTLDYNEEFYKQWSERNRVRNDGFQLNSGHAYEGIIRAYASEFEAHPEYLCPPENDQKNPKFRIMNPDLRQLVVRYALKFFETKPHADSVSVDPSDDGGWCEEKLDDRSISVSDRVLLLANQVAAALTEQYPDKFVAFYAYNYHSPPPNTVRAHPKVIVNVATAFIKGGYTVDQLIECWRKMGVQIFGIREYYSVNTWDRDLPGKSRGSNLDYLTSTIPHFHAMGARLMSAESSDNWAVNGLGYYVASRLLWSVADAKKRDAIIDDFLTQSFGPARGPMAGFYALIDGANRPVLSQDLMGRMYRLLEEATKLTDDPKIQARLDDLTLYTRYVELFRAYQTAQGVERQHAFEQVIRHAYRMRRTMMIYTKGLYRDLVRRDKSVTIPEGAAWDVPEAQNPWKSSEPFTAAELQKMRGEGIARNVLLTWTPVTYSQRLVPLPSSATTALPDHKAPPPATAVFRDRGQRRFHVWINQASATLHLNVTGGLIAHYRDRGHVKIELYAVDASSERLVDSDETVPPDGQEHAVVLKTDTPGLYRLEMTDGGDATQVVFEPGENVVLEMGREQAPRRFGRWTLYFYVPPGTPVVGGYRTGAGRIVDAKGQVRYQADRADGADYFTIQTPEGPDQDDAADHFIIQIPEGSDGQVWRCVGCTGAWRLMTVPPYFAHSPQTLLVPAEVLGNDRQ